MGCMRRRFDGNAESSSKRSKQMWWRITSSPTQSILQARQKHRESNRRLHDGRCVRRPNERTALSFRFHSVFLFWRLSHFAWVHPVKMASELLLFWDLDSKDNIRGRPDVIIISLKWARESERHREGARERGCWGLMGSVILVGTQRMNWCFGNAGSQQSFC